MPSAPLVSAIRNRAQAAALSPDESLIESLAAYLDLLRVWNRRINLTAFDLDAPSDAAIDRLVIESLRAALEVRSTERDVVDVGSGGGSPAIPLKLALPELRMTLVEARAKKTAFLREAVRTLNLANVDVETARVGEDWPGQSASTRGADLITMRAVRAESALWPVLTDILKQQGRIFWFVDLVTNPIILVKPQNMSYPGRFVATQPFSGFTILSRPV